MFLDQLGQREELKRPRKEVAELRRANAILKDASAYFRDGARADPAKVARNVEERREIFGVEPICRVHGVVVSPGNTPMLSAR